MSFSYKKETDVQKHTHYYRELNFKIRMERINNDIAKLYFLDINNNPQAIPIGISCKNAQNFHNNEQAQIIDNIECFLIVWYNDYKIDYHDRTIFSLYNQKQQSFDTEGQAERNYGRLTWNQFQ